MVRLQYSTHDADGVALIFSALSKDFFLRITATSNAPTIGKKRRMDDDEDEDMEAEGSTRKRRGQIERSDTDEFGAKPAPKETDPDVKEMTQGVKDVELEDKVEEGEKMSSPTEAKQQPAGGEVKEPEAAKVEEIPQKEYEVAVDVETKDKGKAKAVDEVAETGPVADGPATLEAQAETVAEAAEAAPVNVVTPSSSDELSAAAAAPIPDSPARDPETSSITKDVEHIEHTDDGTTETVSPAGLTTHTSISAA